MRRQRYGCPPEAVTPQSFLASEFTEALAQVSSKRQEIKEQVIEKAKRESGLTTLLRETENVWHELTGTSLNFSLITNPEKDSPLGRKIQQATEHLGKLEEALDAAYTDASLRLSLGKGAEEKMSQLEAFSAAIKILLAGSATEQIY